MRQPFQVLVYPARVAGDDWEYLLLRRVPGRGGFWQGITGGVEAGEELAGAAVRELAEEAGLVPSALEQIDCSYTLSMQDEWRELYAAGVEEIVEYVFLALVDRQQEPALSWEHDAWQWCSLEEALGLLSYPGNIEALKICDRFVKTWESAR
jgi:8-oxo-dGTP pyrophosphatase MutT (NUDIX family)